MEPKPIVSASCLIRLADIELDVSGAHQQDPARVQPKGTLFPFRIERIEPGIEPGSSIEDPGIAMWSLFETNMPSWSPPNSAIPSTTILVAQKGEQCQGVCRCLLCVFTVC